MTSQNFRIIPYVNPKSGNQSLRVTGTLNGKQVRQNAKDMTAAVTIKQNLERQALNMTPLPSVTTRLTLAQASEAEAAFHRLTGSPLSLTKAVDFALSN